MRLWMIYEAAILVLFVVSALVIMLWVNTAVPDALEGDASAAEYFQRGNRLYAAGRAKYNKASIQYWEAIKRNPHIAEAHLRLAEIYYEYTVWDHQVLHELEEVERIDPNSPGLYLLMGKVYNRMGYSDRTLKAFHRAVILQPGNSEAHYYLGTVYEQKAMKEEAIGEYQKAVEADSDSAMVLNAHLQLGRIYKDKNPEKAESEFRAALDIAPTSAEVMSELRALYREEARDYENRDDYDKAVEKYEEMLKIDPDNPRNVEIYMKLGNIYRNQASEKGLSETKDTATSASVNELYNKAAAMYEAAAKLDPLNFDAFSALKELELLKETNSQ